ncbi:hypothetical protein B0H11DRAFT_1918330 [Mycena galericulata]|nr:hypothetical protein B0H11DRAFT_1918330 [Mycena galericulata]
MANKKKHERTTASTRNTGSRKAAKAAAETDENTPPAGMPTPKPKPKYKEALRHTNTPEDTAAAALLSMGSAVDPPAMNIDASTELADASNKSVDKSDELAGSFNTLDAAGINDATDYDWITHDNGSKDSDKDQNTEESEKDDSDTSEEEEDENEIGAFIEQWVHKEIDDIVSHVIPKAPRLKVPPMFPILFEVPYKNKRRAISGSWNLICPQLLAFHLSCCGLATSRAGRVDWKQDVSSARGGGTPWEYIRDKEIARLLYKNGTRDLTGITSRTSFDDFLVSVAAKMNTRITLMSNIAYIPSYKPKNPKPRPKLLEDEEA